VPAAHPLDSVYHLAGVIDDGLLDSLDGERLARVFAPKAHAAWHLHELTSELDLSQFVIFSSGAGLVGSPAQANYSAANAFLDTLALHRHARGLPAVSLAWGAWAIGMALHRDLESVDLMRHNRLGLASMSGERGLELFDLALAVDGSHLVPIELERSALEAMAASDLMPPIMRGLVRVRSGRGRERDSLSQRLKGLAADAREQLVLDLVRSHAATVLGLPDAGDVDADRAFQELGFDSLGAVELRNRLAADTGLRLQPTLIFDHPSVRAIATFLLAEALPDEDALRRGPSALVAEEPPELDGELAEQIDSMDIDELAEQMLERQQAGLEQGEGSGDE
jgi:acyl carrier protein